MGRKQAQVTLTYNILYYPKDICEDGNKISKEEFRETVNEHVDQIVGDIADATNLVVDEVETEILGFDEIDIQLSDFIDSLNKIIDEDGDMTISVLNKNDWSEIHRKIDAQRLRRKIRW